MYSALDLLVITTHTHVGIYYNSENNGVLISYIIIYLGLKTRKLTYYYVFIDIIKITGNRGLADSVATQYYNNNIYISTKNSHNK